MNGLLSAVPVGRMSVIGFRKMIAFPFGTVKICFDTTIVLSVIIFSLCVFHNITGIREGTLIAAIAVGLLVKVYHKPLQKLKNYLLK
jgi:uncharacterized membrane protein YczE